MKIPEGMTETQVSEIIEKAIKGLSYKFKFGYYEAEDLYQEGWILAMDALEIYDGSHPLENFLRVHIRNQFINLKRNKFKRAEPPCTSCPFYDPECKLSKNKCSEYENKDDCGKWVAWNKRNAAKSSLVRPLDVESLSEDDHDIDREFLNKMNYGEIIAKINQEMPIELRGDFLKMLDGVNISKVKKQRIKDFMGELGITDELEDWQIK